MKIYIDEELPKSCASCQFLVHCDQCEGTENYCPFVGSVGYDISDTLIDGAPITPSSERHEECPLEQRPHSEWLPMMTKDDYGEQVLGYKCKTCGWLKQHDKMPFCENCGASMKKEDERPHGEWIEKPWGVVCSRCKAQALHTPNGNQSRSDYCPNCGASMKREGE